MTIELKPCPAGHLHEFFDALNGKKGDLDAWLECNNEAEVKMAIQGAIARAESAEIERLRARVAELETAQAWRPIESAPNDRLTFLGWADDDIKFIFREQGKWYEHNNGDYYDGGYGKPYLIRPTHWMPLPKGPEE